MDFARLLGVEATYSHVKLAAVLGTTALYAAAVLALHEAVGASILILVTVPVLLAAWSFGVRAALLASALAFLMNVALATSVMGESLAMWLSAGGVLGGSVVLVTGLVVGRLRDLGGRLEQELSGRAVTQTALERSEERLRVALDSMVDAVLTIDLRGRLTYLNPAAEQLFGYGGSEVLGKNVNVLMPEPYRAEHGSYLKNYERTGVPKVIGIGREVAGRRKDGSTFDMELSVGELPVEGGRGFIGIARDVTARKETEAVISELNGELEQRIRQRQLIINQGPDPMFVSRVDNFMFTEVNDRACERYGYSRQEFLALNIFDLEVEPPLKEAVRALYDDTPIGRVVEVYGTNKTKDGRSFPVHVRFTKLDDEFAVASVRDITEQRKYEAQLQQTHEQLVAQQASALESSEAAAAQLNRRFQDLVENTRDLLWETDANCVYTYCSPNSAAILGRSPDELIGRSLDAYMTPQEGRRVREMFDTIRGSGRPSSMVQYEVPRSDGTRCVLESSATPILDGDGVLLGFRGVDRDITERLRAEERFQQTRHLASIGELAAGVAHEINNPLNGVMGFTQLVLGEESLSEQARSDLETVYGESQRASKIVQNLLSFARKREPERRPVDVRSIVEQACHLEEYDLRKHAIELRTRFPRRLPLVLGDEQQLTEVVLNLLTNAEQAIAATGRPGVVTVACSAPVGRVQITVTNDGPGIPPEVLGRIFEPFFTTKEVGEGTGLGLSVCQGIVREHEGELWAQSTLGGDTTFYITLPAQRVRPRKVAAPEPEQRQVAGMHVLVVDDEPHARKLMARALAKDNHLVEEASDGSDAWDQIRRTPYDCVIADLRMPGTSGQELYRLVEESDPELAARFIFVTGDTMGPETLSFLSSVDGRSLMKPIDVGELRRRVADLQDSSEGNGKSAHAPDPAESGGHPQPRSRPEAAR